MSTEMTTTENPTNALLAKVTDKRAPVGVRMDSISQLLKANAPKLMAALPRHVTPDRMIRVVINCITKNPKLLDCTPASLFGAIAEAATYGWELGGVMGHAYLVPYREQCTLIPGYKGLLDLCRRSGQISTFAIESVYEGDKFSYELGMNPKVTHSPSNDPDRTNKPITHTYFVVRMRDGGVQVSVWATAQVERHKEAYSQGWRWAEKGDKAKGGGKKDSPWHTAWATMAKKTVVRDMIQRGLVPLSAEHRSIVDRLEHDEDDVNTFTAVDLLGVADGGLSALPSPDDEPPPEATHDRPESTEEVCPDTIDGFRADLADCTSADLVDTCQNSWLPRCPNEPTRTVVMAECHQKRQGFSKGKAKQKELV